MSELVPPRCVILIDVADVPCAHLRERLGRYCGDCPLRKEST